MLIASSMIIHGLWDSLGGLTGWASWTIGLYFPLSLIGLVIFIWVYRYTVVQDAEWPVSPGRRSPPQRHQRRRAGGSDRHPQATQALRQVRAARPARRHVLEGIMDLADAIAASDGLDSPSIDRGRSEIGRLPAAPPLA